MPVSESELTTLIATAARASFSDVRAAIGADNIVGYAILSHDSADSCCPVVLTRHWLAERTEVSPDDVRFDPVEWDVFQRDTHFDNAQAALEALYKAGEASEDDSDEDWHAAFRELVFSSCVGALDTLVQTTFFGPEQPRDRLFITFSLSDSATSRTHSPGWVQRLNTLTVRNAFLAWHRRGYPAA
ncbi:MAG: hypothetical protein RLZZ618_102 [Pseudomonadota bacterium]